MLRRANPRTPRLHRRSGNLTEHDLAWTFEIHRLVVEGDNAVSEVTASDGEQTARLVAFSIVRNGHTAEQTEYWPTPYDPPSGREHLTRPTDRIP